MFELRWLVTSRAVIGGNMHSANVNTDGTYPALSEEIKVLQYRTKTKMPANRHNLGIYDHVYNAQALDWGEWIDVPEEIIHE